MTTPDLRSGYSAGLVAIVNAADQTDLQVRFAQHCIANGVSIKDIAKQFGVSRPAVYGWFKGTAKPSFAHRERMHDILGDPRPV